MMDNIGPGEVFASVSFGSPQRDTPLFDVDGVEMREGGTLSEHMKAVTRALGRPVVFEDSSQYQHKPPAKTTARKLCSTIEPHARKADRKKRPGTRGSK